MRLIDPVGESGIDIVEGSLRETGIWSALEQQKKNFTTRGRSFITPYRSASSAKSASSVTTFDIDAGLVGRSSRHKSDK